MMIYPQDNYPNSAFGPDTHPWYLSLEHAMFIDGERTTFEAKPTRQVSGVARLYRFTLASFTESYVLPIFKSWVGH